MNVIRCSSCGNQLEYLGGLNQTFKPSASVPDLGEYDPFEQWRGNVCLSCRAVFCPSCIEVGGPTPCPKCGRPTAPAQKDYIESLSETRQHLGITREYSICFAWPYDSWRAPKRKFLSRLFGTMSSQTHSHKLPLSPAAKFFDSLSEGQKKGYIFPYDAPWQIALVEHSNIGAQAIVVVVQLDSNVDESVEVRKRLAQWFDLCGAEKYQDYEWLSAPLPGKSYGDIQSLLKTHSVGKYYRIIKKLGNINR
jgi:hypothetical protein